jgi:hypothetical protein
MGIDRPAKTLMNPVLNNMNIMRKIENIFRDLP